MRSLLENSIIWPLWVWLPFIIIFLLCIYASIAFRVQNNSRADKGKDTTAHSERIYKDFEMYLKVNLGLVAAIGYSQITEVKTLSKWELGNIQLMIASMSLLVMVTFSIFIISHQSSKIRRWWSVEWKTMFFWQELWACFSIWAFSSGVWWYCWKTI